MAFNLHAIFICRCTIKLRRNCATCRTTGTFVTCYTFSMPQRRQYPITDLNFTRREILLLQNRKLRISTSSVTCSNNSNALLTTACTKHDVAPNRKKLYFWFSPLPVGKKNKSGLCKTTASCLAFGTFWT